MSATPGRKPSPVAGSQADEPIAGGDDPLQNVVLHAVPGDGRVLLLGSTGEAWAAKLRDRGCRLIVLEKDRRTALRMAPYAERVIVNTLAWPELKGEIPEGPYDAIVAVGFVEAGPTPATALRDLKDLLTPEGHLVVCCANFAHAGMRVSLLEQGTLPLEDNGPVSADYMNYLTRSGLEQTIEQAGLLIGRLDRVQQPLESLPGVPRNLDPSMREQLEADPDASTSHFVIVAYPSNLPHLQAIQERMRGMAEEREALLRERAEMEASHAQAQAEMEAGHAQARAEKEARGAEEREAFLRERAEMEASHAQAQAEMEAGHAQAQAEMEARGAEGREAFLRERTEMEASHAQAQAEMEAGHAQAQAEIEARHAQARAEMEAGHAQVLAEIEAGHAQARAEIEARGAKQRAQMGKRIRGQASELSGLLDLTRRQGSEITERKSRQQNQEAKLEVQETKLEQAQATEEAYEVVLAELHRVKQSPGWKLNAAYRRWVKRNVWSRPWLMRIYEGFFSLVSRRPAPIPEAAPTPKAAAAYPSPAPSSRDRAKTEPKPPRVQAPKASPHAPPTEFQIYLDHPKPDSKRTLAGRLLVRGWALASSPIESVFVQVDDGPECKALYGKTRRDVSEVHPEYADAAKSGFELRWNVPRGQGGLHQLRIIAITSEGARGELVHEVLIDDRDAYEIWVRRNALSDSDKLDMLHESEKFGRRPLVTVVTPVYCTDPADLERCVESVFAQIYPRWELCLVDDGSNDPSLTKALEEFAAKDSRVKTIALENNSGIAAATNAGIDRATGDYVAFLDHDNEIAPEALYRVVQTINDAPDVEVFYSDEDKIDLQGNRFGHFFKPDWSADLIHGMNYACHFLVAKRDLLKQIGGLRLGFDGAQDYDLILRLWEKTDEIKRVSGVLYHWRAAPGSTAIDVGNKPAASDAGRRALEDHVERLNLDAEVIETGPGRYHVRYGIADEPLVSILVPTGGRVDRLEEAVESVFEKTDYANYEIVVVDNSSDELTSELIERHAAAGRPIRRLDLQGEQFNFARLCNSASRATDADLLLFLNDDVTIITRHWLTSMVEHGRRDRIGAVGARLLFPDRQIQHAGVVLGVFGTAGHCFKGIDADEQHYGDLPELVRNCLAVTGACLLVDRERFWEVGGFAEENLPIAFQDVDLCLKLHEAGYRNIYTPHAELYHHEASSKSDAQYTPSDPEVAYMRSRWGKYIEDDPFYNPHLTREGEDFSLRL